MNNNIIKTTAAQRPKKFLTNPFKKPKPVEGPQGPKKTYTKNKQPIESKLSIDSTSSFESTSSSGSKTRIDSTSSSSSKTRVDSTSSSDSTSASEETSASNPTKPEPHTGAIPKVTKKVATRRPIKSSDSNKPLTLKVTTDIYSNDNIIFEQMLIFSDTTKYSKVNKPKPRDTPSQKNLKSIVRHIDELDWAIHTELRKNPRLSLSEMSSSQLQLSNPILYNLFKERTQLLGEKSQILSDHSLLPKHIKTLEKMLIAKETHQLTSRQLIQLLREDILNLNIQLESLPIKKTQNNSDTPTTSNTSTLNTPTTPDTPTPTTPETPTPPLPYRSSIVDAPFPPPIKPAKPPVPPKPTNIPPITDPAPIINNTPGCRRNISIPHSNQGEVETSGIAGLLKTYDEDTLSLYQNLGIIKSKDLTSNDSNENSNKQGKFRKPILSLVSDTESTDEVDTDA